MSRRRRAEVERRLEPFVSWVELDAARAEAAQAETGDAFPFTLPCVAALGQRLALDPFVTFFVGENGSGKSTLMEGVAVALGYNAEGGTRNFRFVTRSSESSLGKCLRVARSHRRPRTGYFLRAESFFNAASYIEELDREPAFAPPIIDSYGGRSLHEQSHGESFMALVRNRFEVSGMYLLDEPESALSPTRQLELLREIRRHCLHGSQFIIATHSPLLLAYPGACIYQLSSQGIQKTSYEETEHYRVTRSFLERPRESLSELFAGLEGGTPGEASSTELDRALATLRALADAGERKG
ncbi:MAG: AAA family ATPase [Myxococcales bacterium]|nr:MAG: AAA family ATPase [Myxococcales bacterium]